MHTSRIFRTLGATTLAAASPGPYTDLFRDGVAPILEDEGYTVEFKDYSELQQANIALHEGGADLNVDQHTAYMEAFNRDAGADLASLTPIPTVPAGLFSSSHTSLDDVADGHTVSIPDDPSNTSRAYRILVQAGWLTLKPGTDDTQITSEDIAENPHNLDINTVDSSIIPRSIDDVDWAVIPGSRSYAAGTDPKLQVLQEELLPELVLVAVTQSDQVDEDWAQAVTDAYNSEEFAEFLDEENKDGYWFVPEGE
ncbi:MAG: MetQ/NlpA family ABC transporter substrate-binding protein [Corynebacterium sp.]|uniref:MetQ/NlpA family ABC transporter substrate-binding protein n=2 Tax=Corynebacterium sp. TaxID=1720 RepID=UPI002647A6E3|nr:MetQ/NlpA family ABC transporter substrate-binding protein [Corynebacterium sp.]MDN6281422.1 MetQ/NlpA family ABC transporter substrate-binding protein [Corynebacterium sp.]MDN6304232.1 MetQ/NlpA family ABC transporter substrate-binding protein [Corynebacterium sp.]MDN6368466.1 MetQ/NlpA family ABC transporter substrate-binding protein [Corynebacterium sp.]MDN6376093.1 MetQ/NlpA family ABC transporter substrate-binding protein [Corynebacterium sp.]MDN6394790.1 MetQ/NlpA family ABC transport